MSKSQILNVCRKDLLDIYSYAVDHIRPNVLVEKSFNIRDHVLTVRDSVKKDVKLEIDGFALHVIGGGKSVLDMAHGLANSVTRSNVQQLFSHGCLSIPIGLKSVHQNGFEVKNCLKSIGVKCIYGSENNLPDKQSVLASQEILDTINLACKSDEQRGLKPLFIVLLSGGGSACLTAPRLITLDKKLHLIKWLVQKGADIVELNKVRRYFSSIKGGKLATHILKSHPEAKILTLIMSDVIGDRIEYIASGPTHLCNGEELSYQKQSMLDVMAKYRYDNLDSILIEGVEDAESQPILKNRTIFNSIIGTNKIALAAAAEKATSLGYTIKHMEEDISGDSKLAIDKLCKLGDDLFEFSRSPVLVLSGGEVTINRLEGEDWGKGGRAQELALDYLIAKSTYLRKSDSIDMFLAGTTDGQDGPTEVAACLASYREWVESGMMSDLKEAKRMHDSYNFWKTIKPEWQVVTGLTGTNVMDLYMYMKRDVGLMH